MSLHANGILVVTESVSGAGLLRKSGFRKKCENEGMLPSFSHFMYQLHHPPPLSGANNPADETRGQVPVSVFLCPLTRGLPKVPLHIHMAVTFEDNALCF